MKNRMLSIIMGLVLIVGLVACGGGSEVVKNDTSNVTAGENKETKNEENSSTEKSKYTLRLQWLPQMQFAGYYVAQAKGFYKEKGFDVEILPGGKVDGLSELKNGEIDFATSLLSTAVETVAKGSNIKNIAQYFNKNMEMLVTRKDDNFLEPKDLAGKKVGIWEVGLFSVPIKALFMQENLEVHYISQNFDMKQFADGSLDAASVMMYNEYNLLLEAGMEESELHVINPADYGLVLPEDGLYTSEKMTNENMDIVKKFVEATTEGWNYAFANRDEAVDIVIKAGEEVAGKMDRTHQEKMIDIIMEYQADENGKIPDDLSKDDFEILKNTLKSAGIISSDVKYEDFYKR
jgi:NitT/TauT family transport system substrate-binding protein